MCDVGGGGGERLYIGEGMVGVLVGLARGLNMEVEGCEVVGKYNIMPNGSIVCKICTRHQCKCKGSDEDSDDSQPFSEDSLKSGEESEDSDDLPMSYQWLKAERRSEARQMELDQRVHEEAVMTQVWLDEHCSSDEASEDSSAVNLPDGRVVEGVGGELGGDEG